MQTPFGSFICSPIFTHLEKIYIHHILWMPCLLAFWDLFFLYIFFIKSHVIQLFQAYFEPCNMLHYAVTYIFAPVLSLQGNIRVFCRVRPLLGDEQLGNDGIISHINFPDIDHRVLELDKLSDMSINEVISKLFLFHINLSWICFVSIARFHYFVVPAFRWCVMESKQKMCCIKMQELSLGTALPVDKWLYTVASVRSHQPWIFAILEAAIALKPTFSSIHGPYNLLPNGIILSVRASLNIFLFISSLHWQQSGKENKGTAQYM